MHSRAHPNSFGTKCDKHYSEAFTTLSSIDDFSSPTKLGGPAYKRWAEPYTKTYFSTQGRHYPPQIHVWIVVQWQTRPEIWPCSYGRMPGMPQTRLMNPRRRESPGPRSLPHWKTQCRVSAHSRGHPQNRKRRRRTPLRHGPNPGSIGHKHTVSDDGEQPRNLFILPWATRPATGRKQITS